MKEKPKVAPFCSLTYDAYVHDCGDFSAAVFQACRFVVAIDSVFRDRRASDEIHTNRAGSVL